MDLASPFDHTVGEAAALIHYPILTIYDAAIPITQIVVIRGVIVMSNGAVPMGVCFRLTISKVDGTRLHRG